MASPIARETLLTQLHWRYAVKKFDPARRIPDADWNALEQALVLTPSSYGLQPWKFVVVTDAATKEKLKALSWNQAQVGDCSHYVVFCIKKPLAVADIDAHLARVREVRDAAPDSTARYRASMVGDLIEGARSWRISDWAANQVYIALGNFITSAALLGIDTCAMEGFEPVKYDQALGLAKRGLAAAVCCAAGYRSADDKYATLAKVRFPLEQVVERL